jgi:hypothetical protein
MDNSNEQLPVLRLLTVCLAGQDQQNQVGLLADIGLFGQLQSGLATAPQLSRAKTAWVERFSSLVSCSDMISDWQGSVLSLATPLCARFIYSVAIGRDKLKVARAVFELARQALAGQRKTPKRELEKTPKRELERVAQAEIDLLADYLNTVPTAQPRLLRDALEQVVVDFPDNVDFLKRFVDLNLRGHAVVGLRRFFDQRAAGT